MSSLIKSHNKVNPAKTSELELSEVILQNDEPLVLIGTIATIDDNNALANALTAKYGKEGSKKRSKPETLNEACRLLYPFHVITGWNVVDDDGKPVPYDSARCRDEIMSALDVYAIGRIIMHFTAPDNFREVLTKADGEEMGNESGG